MSENILRPWRRRGLQIIVGECFRTYTRNDSVDAAIITSDSKQEDQGEEQLKTLGTHRGEEQLKPLGAHRGEEQLKPLGTQIAGHGSEAGDKGMMTNNSGCILKPIQKPPRGLREIKFYQTISNNAADEHVKAFIEFTPKFLGTKIWTNQEGAEEEFLMMENLAQGYSKPSIMDIKIGAKTYGPDASEEKRKKLDAKYAGTKKPFGFSVLGMSVYHGNELEKVKVLDREYGNQLGEEEVEEVVGIYLNVQENDGDAVKVIAESFVEQLRGILNLFECQTKFHIFGSSLLFVYDSAAIAKYTVKQDKSLLKEACRVKMIDFAHVHPAQGQLDQNYIFGCQNVLKLFSKLVD